MVKLENVLLSFLIIICVLVSATFVESVIGEGQIIGTALAASVRTLNRNSIGSYYIIPNMVRFEEDAFFDRGTALEINAQTSIDGWQVFRNEGYAFELSYPDTILPINNPDQKALNAGLDVLEGTPVWQFNLVDPSFFQGTNLVEASIVVQVSRGEDALSACLSYKSGSIYLRSGEDLPVLEINQVSYLKDVVQEGAMGGSYQRISHRAVSQGACYELTQVIHSKNIENFVPGTIQNFDGPTVSSLLDQILGTFKLLDTEATFPEMVFAEAKSLPMAVAAAAGEHADGIDVSHWQGDIGWGQVGNAGYAFAFVKGTEGVGWTDSRFIQNMTENPSAGVMRGVYHFARPDLGNTGQEEAEYFLSVAGDYLQSGYLRPVLDLEVRGSMGQAALSAWVMEWMQTVENQSGVAPLIYTNLYYVNNYLTDAVTEYDLWIAYWTTGCDSTVTFSIPPTGRWSDWAFWQYCVAPAGTVPGITTTIDLDIFNGIETGLTEYDAASPLWVSLTSDAYRASNPYYADITADVNGDATGPINYHFWWNCDSLEADITSVESSCGVLPQPVAGECLKDDVGMMCNAVANEVQLAEYTYQMIGDFTAKVIIERGAAPPAEDRYHISVINSLISLSADPVSPGVGTPYEDYAVSVDVVTKPSIDGVVQVEIIENGSLIPLDSDCQAVVGDVQVTRTFDLTIPWSAGETVNYMIWARYRPGVLCPVADENTDDLSSAYVIDWNELSGVGEMDVQGNGQSIVDGDASPSLTDDTDFGSIDVSTGTAVHTFIIENTGIGDLNLTDSPEVQINGINAADFTVTSQPASPIAASGGVTTFEITFDPSAEGLRTAEISIANDDTDENPYNYAIQGNGTPSCYQLSLNHDGDGSNPQATPDNSIGCEQGYYNAGETIQLLDAVPSFWWMISGWSGSDNDASTSSINSVSMPDTDHSVSVIYEEIPLASTWYLAEGFTGSGFQTFILIQNPNDIEAAIDVTYMLQGGGTIEKSLTIPPNSRFTIVTHDPDQVGLDQAFSTKLVSNQPIIVERAMYFNNDGHNTVGVEAPASSWYLAEGYTGSGFGTFVLIQNPNSTETNVDIRYMLQGGGTIDKSVTVSPNSRYTIVTHDADQVGIDQAFSTKIDSDQPIIVERAMYWPSGETSLGGHDSNGVLNPSLEWNIAEGYTGDGFDTFILVQNPNDTEANVSIIYMLQGGGILNSDIIVPPNSRFTIIAHNPDQVGTGFAFSTNLVSDQLIIVERAMYFLNGGHNTRGVAE